MYSGVGVDVSEALQDVACRQKQLQSQYKIRIRLNIEELTQRLQRS